MRCSASVRVAVPAVLRHAERSYFYHGLLGQWFRYFTGAVEILGGVLVLVPRPEAPKMTTRAALLRSREAQKQQAQYDLARVRAGRMKLKQLELA